MLRNVRWRTGKFADRFTFSPIGSTLLAHDYSEEYSRWAGGSRLGGDVGLADEQVDLGGGDCCGPTCPGGQAAGAVPEGVAGRAVSAEELLERVWDEFADPFTTAVKITIGRLRAKLGDPPLIETVPRSGYRIGG
jgi:hypothetical protein